MTFTSKYKGKKIKIEISGSSHGKEIVIAVSGLKGFAFDNSAVLSALERRSAKNAVGATERKESDIPHYLSGVKNGKITGKLKISFANEKQNSNEYAKLYGVPRPSHADVGRYFKNGELDFTGGGEYSGRLTVALCAVGAIAADILKANYGCEINAKLVAAGNACGDENAMNAEISSAKAEGDSVGGRIDCVIKNCPKGLGGSLFDGIDGKIAQLVYAVPAVRGVEFGKGFALCGMRGSAANDGMRYDGEKIVFEKNDEGGVFGGITCGDEITFSVAFKPTPSIGKTQSTVNLLTGENAEISVCGRHDACVARRAAPIIEGVAAIAVLDEILYERDRRFKKRG